MKFFLLTSFIFFIAHLSWGQQSIKGQIKDSQSDQPLIGAVVQIIGLQNSGTVSDLDGYFTIENINPGRYNLYITYLGYEPVELPNILVTAGKEVFLEIPIRESIFEMEEIVVTGETEKDKPLNEMATVSARMFTLEEVTRYSGGRNDASRMAANFAGVNISNDSRNDIVIRGNSPVGVLWRLEGIPIPNPNHFATLGTTGGPVSALNTNLLKNSDFLTGAFPAEYGNGNAGVFDIEFRNGNKDKYEFTAQLAAFSGLEVMAEGPLGKQNGSFLVSFRNSFVELAHAAGLNIGTEATPAYRDLTFKLNFGKSAIGNFTLFGIGGTSDIDFLAEEVTEDDFFANQDEDAHAESLLGIIGLKHQLLLNKNSYWHTTISASTGQNQFNVKEILPDNSRDLRFDGDDANSRISINSYIHNKINARNSIRLGLLSESYFIDAFLREKENDEWNQLRDFNDNLNLFQAYVQWQHRLGSNWTLNLGAHSLLLDFNNNLEVEPRASLQWKYSPKQSLSFAYGMHHQLLPLPMYLLQIPGDDGKPILSNRDSEFLRSQHFVLAYDYKLGQDWRFKAEVYYQALSNIPVEPFSSSFSVLNVGEDFGFPERHFLVNEGTGTNYGLELTLEKFFSKNYYVLLTGSLFDSKYKGSDGVERNTAFNNQYILNVLGGKEFPMKRNPANAFTFDFRVSTAGGRNYTPIDLAASRATGSEVKMDEIAFSERYDPYFRLDLKFGIRLNHPSKKRSQQFFLDFQNITNRENIFIQRYNDSTGEINTVYQIGFFPDILYRIQF